MKRVLFDENMPRQLRRDLPEVYVRTVQEMGWSGLTNGALLLRASESFDVFLTADQRLQQQQDVARFDIAVVAIRTYDTRLSNLRRLLPQLHAAIERASKRSVIVVPEWG